MNFPTCQNDPQPKSTEIFIGNNPVSLTHSVTNVTIGNVQLTMGIHDGEFNSRLLMTESNAHLSLIDNGISFKDTNTSRNLEVTGEKATDDPGFTKLVIKSTCNQ